MDSAPAIQITLGQTVYLAESGRAATVVSIPYDRRRMQYGLAFRETLARRADMPNAQPRIDGFYYRGEFRVAGPSKGAAA